jgi:hypothetical protein
MRALIFLCTMVLFGCQSQTDGSRCDSKPFVQYSRDFVEIFVCIKDEKKRIDKFSAPGEGVYLIEVPRGNRPSLLVANSVSNLAANSRSVTVLIYDMGSGEPIFHGMSKSSVAPNDANSDGVVELILYEDIVDFDSLLLSNIGWPTIVELSDPISIGAFEDYESLRMQLLKTATEAKTKFAAACVFEGERDPLCGAAKDLEKLELFIDVLSIAR